MIDPLCLVSVQYQRRHLCQWFGAGVQFASVDVKLSPFVPEPPRVQQVAVVFNPALDTGVFQNIAR